MDNLFIESDFSLFTQYQGKTQEEAPEGQQKLRTIYDKLGKVIDKLREVGYPAEIIRNPLIQGGPSTFKYCEYHWSKIYPLNTDLAKECRDKVFVVIGTTENGINIHIDSNSRKGFDSNKNETTRKIKDNSWIEWKPSDAALFTCEQLAQKVAEFYKTNWKQFNIFAREFRIKESIKILKDMEIHNIKNLFENNHNLILTGAPGTGKTHLALEIAKAMGATYKLVQFHPSYDYTDFVEGLRPIQDKNGNVGFERKDGVFKEFCKSALKNPNDKYVFIIDEINRGEISKIFGELFFSIDPGYRGIQGKVCTQYQNLLKYTMDVFKDGFYVPENVYIIGTMNDIDRSVESMDFAFRRRFAFKEIKASDKQDMLSSLNNPNLEKEVQERMNRLNEAIEKIEGLSSAYHIGASYFLKLENYINDSDKGFASLWNYHLEGLLREYLRGSEDIENTITKLKEAYENESTPINGQP